MIRVRESTHKELVKLAKYGDAMSDIIDQLLETYHNNNSKTKDDKIKSTKK